MDKSVPTIIVHMTHDTLFITHDDSSPIEPFLMDTSKVMLLPYPIMTMG